jgi:hypothetical protein
MTKWGEEKNRKRECEKRIETLSLFISIQFNFYFMFFLRNYKILFWEIKNNSKTIVIFNDWTYVTTHPLTKIRLSINVNAK